MKDRSKYSVDVGLVPLSYFIHNYIGDNSDLSNTPPMMTDGVRVKRDIDKEKERHALCQSPERERHLTGIIRDPLLTFLFLE